MTKSNLKEIFQIKVENLFNSKLIVTFMDKIKSLA